MEICHLLSIGTPISNEIVGSSRIWNSGCRLRKWSIRNKSREYRIYKCSARLLPYSAPINGDYYNLQKENEKVVF
jgi:hypothetical protein